MKISHSQLNTILTCPATYYLNYVEGIKLKIIKPALSVGSMFHYFVEHNSTSEEIVEQYYKENNIPDINPYSNDEVMAIAMANGYFKIKDKIFEEILKDNDTGEPVELIEEFHELKIESPLKSYDYKDDHSFIGIIDLLLVTNKGFIIIDYKTSSATPDWSKYLDQLYRYNFLLNSKFENVPIYKIAIINARKSQIKKRKTENDESFKKRLALEYELNEDLICTHVFDNCELDKDLMNDYFENLSHCVDFAQMISEKAKHKEFFINYTNMKSVYGKSEYYDIAYNTPFAEQNYIIRDSWYNEDTGEIESHRDCVQIDMQVLKHHNVLNHYETFKEIFINNSDNYEDFYSIRDATIDCIKNNYIYDNELLNNYLMVLAKELNI